MAEGSGPGVGLSRRWLENYPPSIPHSIDDRVTRTLVELLEEGRRRYADRPALESFGVSLTYAEVGNIADRIAAFLQGRGIAKGDRVAIMLPNVAAYIPIIFGVLKAGAIVVNTNPLYTPRELAHQMKDSGARAIFYLCIFDETVSAARHEVSFDTVVRVNVGDLLGLKGRIISRVARRKAGVKPRSQMGDVVSFRDALKQGRKRKLVPVSVALGDIAFLQYTGGTTGVSKGAALRHSNVVANVEQCTAWFGPALDYTKKRHVLVAALPLYHIFGLTAAALLMLNIGGCSLLIANPRDLKGFIKTLKKRPFSILAGVNTLFAALADHPRFAKVNFSRLVLCVGGGMATKSAVAEKWKRITGHPIVEGYGLSETSPGVTFNRADIDTFTGTIGYPWPSTDVDIRDSEGRSLPEGSVGEICAKGPQVMLGYWNRPEETAAAFHADGFLRTGDMGMMLPDGQFKLVDRLKELIIVSGFNVYPNEVEDVIAHIPQVREVAVVGLSDSHSGEAVTAFVVRRDDSLTAEQVREHCRQQLTGYKVPKRVIFRDELPKSNVGKVLRRVLREETEKA
ncbi:MAG: AMP-binding protein [Hyphomicrobium sp.]